MSTLEPNIIFTENAARTVKNLIEEEGNPKLNLRVSIKGGGCSGFQYIFTFDEEINPEDDYIIEKKLSEGSVRLLVDAMSYMYLQGAEIDHTSGVEGEQFIIRNPNAKTTCGCGSSFAVQEEEEENEDTEK